MEAATNQARHRHTLKFGAYELDVEAEALYLRGVHVHLQDMPLKVLTILLERPGELIRHEEFYRRLWPDDELGLLEDNLYTAVRKLRHALDDSPRRPRFIETVPRKGYRFVAPAHFPPDPVETAENAQTVASHHAGGRAPRGYVWISIAAILVLTVATGGYFLAASGPTPGIADAGASGREPPTVAVLPFVNLDGDPEQDYFSDGLTEELIGSLARVSGLRVLSPTSAFAFKGREDLELREICVALGAHALLEGSVRTDGDRVRVNAQLIDTATGLHYWSQTYDRELIDVFDIQEDLTVRITQALHRELTPDEHARLARRPTGNSDAYRLYLKGRHAWAQRTPDALHRAIGYYRRAIEADPEFAAAYAGLPSVYGPLGELGYLDPGSARARAERPARRALEIDPDLPEAHMALGAWHHLYQWDWKNAERGYRRAIALNPEDSWARAWYAYLLQSLGRFEEAEEQLKTALALDPLSPLILGNLGFGALMRQEFDEAERHYREAIELNPEFWLAFAGLGKTYEAQGKFRQAAEAYANAAALAGPTPRADADLARAKALAGDDREARRILGTLVQQTEESNNYFPNIATVFEALGDTDGAFEWLERSFAQRHPHLNRFNVDPGFGHLHEDPRAAALARRIGLSE